MKNLNYLLSGFVIIILVGCNNNQTHNNNQAIVGIWQNTATANTAIEFTKDGNYYLRLNGERLLIDDSLVEKYSYDPISEGNNLIIYGNPKAGNTQSKLVVITPVRIKISMVSHGITTSEAEFSKVKDQ
jgi:hypothetical protein